nr:hypothetical protein [Roseibium sp.]
MQGLFQFLVGTDWNVRFPDFSLDICELSLQLCHLGRSGSFAVDPVGLGSELVKDGCEIADTGSCGKQKPADVAFAVDNLFAALFDRYVIKTEQVPVVCF